MNIAHDITFHYITRLRRHSDELTLIVQGHLLIEFVVNEIIRKSLKRPKAVLDDHRSYTFAIKARILYSTGLLPEHIFCNIQRVNAIRNHLAHNLEWEHLKIDFQFTRDDEEVQGNIEIRDGRTKRKPTTKQYVKILCLGTLTQLRNHFFETYGAFPAPADVA